MSKKEYCNECFVELDPSSFCEDTCDDCLNAPETKEEKVKLSKSKNKEVWIEVKSPFKYYPPSEGK